MPVPTVVGPLASAVAMDAGRRLGINGHNRLRAHRLALKFTWQEADTENIFYHKTFDAYSVKKLPHPA
jgi:hypothetical protein